jgi:acyl carrier protein
VLAKTAFKELREELFGDSICFMITGGGGVSPEALRFFNAIGYTLANGYGMTEIGITSVEDSDKRKKRVLASIGSPFCCTEYRVSEAGELEVKGKTRASRIMQDGKEKISNFDEWFETHDLARVENDGRYYLLGREDDLIVCKNGEKINPELVEGDLYVPNVEALCLFADAQKRPTLILSVSNCFTAEKIQEVYDNVKEALEKAKIKDEVQNIVLTKDKLLDSSDFKVSRKKIAKRFAAGEFTLLDRQTAATAEQFLSTLEKELRACFAETLQIPEDSVTKTADFFMDLGGSSLDYFTLLDMMKEKFDIEVEVTEEEQPSTVEDFYKIISNM